MQFRPHQLFGLVSEDLMVDALPYSIVPSVSIREIASGFFQRESEKVVAMQPLVHLNVS